MQVDKAGQNYQPRRVDHSCACAPACDVHEATALDYEIGRRAVRQHRTRDDDHRPVSPS